MNSGSDCSIQFHARGGRLLESPFVPSGFVSVTKPPFQWTGRRRAKTKLEYVAARLLCSFKAPSGCAAAIRGFAC